MLLYNIKWLNNYASIQTSITMFFFLQLVMPRQNVKQNCIGIRNAGFLILIIVDVLWILMFFRSLHSLLSNSNILLHASLLYAMVSISLFAKFHCLNVMFASTSSRTFLKWECCIIAVLLM